MTFCGDLPFVPSGIHHHLFENLRRMGHHCHGRKRLSGGRPQKFLPASGQKVLRDVHFTPGLAETVVAVFAPGDRGLNGCRAPDTTTGRHPPQRREARFAKRRCSLHPGVFLPGCQERRSRRDKGGATVPVAANPGFCVRDGSPPGRRQLRWLRSRQPAPPGGRPEKALPGEQQN
ncbi:hypothetical protein BvCmsSIP042_00858 [Escherichia coli]|nr:hypothetical protein BvCmsSIP042_00858 [Escherichia coli]